MERMLVACRSGDHRQAYLEGYIAAALCCGAIKEVRERNYRNDPKTREELFGDKGEETMRRLGFGEEEGVYIMEAVIVDKKMTRKVLEDMEIRLNLRSIIFEE